MNEEEKKRHENIKKKLKIIGTILLVIGIVCEIAGMLDIFLVANSQGRMPSLFFLAFLGAPLIMVGIVMLIFACRREILSYTKNEVVPVVNDAAQELTPAIKSVMNAVKDGLKTEDGAIEDTRTTAVPSGTVCPACGAVNQPKNKFCDKGGVKLFKICPSCGAKQEGVDAFCGECGAKLD